MTEFETLELAALEENDARLRAAGSETFSFEQQRLFDFRAANGGLETPCGDTAGGRVPFLIWTLAGCVIGSAAVIAPRFLTPSDNPPRNP
mgnify:CR=1 FL=1